MSLAKCAFVTLAFHAKSHNILSHGTPTHPETHKLTNIEEHIQQNIQSVMHKIEEKETSKNSDELQSLKALAHTLRREFDALKKE